MEGRFLKTGLCEESDEDTRMFTFDSNAAGYPS